MPYNTNPTQHYEFTYYTGSVTTSGQYLPVGNGTDATRLSSGNISLVSNNSGGATLTGTTIDIPNGTTGGPIVLRLTLTNPAGVDGGYLVIADNSINNPASNTKYDSTMIGTAKPFSGERQGNTTVFADGGANSHTHFTPQIQTTAPTRQFIGKYRTGDTTTATSAAWVNGSGDNGAVLYQGKTITTSNIAIGEQSEYLTTYYIHTNGIGNCNDHDITITSKTRVTYLGTSNRCGGETKQLLSMRPYGTIPVQIRITIIVHSPMIVILSLHPVYIRDFMNG